MSFIVQKKNGQLIFKDKHGFQSRNKSTIWCIQQADLIYNWKDFQPFEVFTGDKYSSENVYSYSKENSFTKLVPDFNFHGWPEAGIDDYSNVVLQMYNNGLNKPIHMKVGWIGNIRTHKSRNKLLQIGKQHPDILDFQHLHIGHGKSTPRYLSLPDLVKQYAILIDVQGVGYSGRLKYLLWSYRPVIIVERNHKEYFFEYLKPWIHYIPVKEDLSDLITKVKWCIDNYDEACEIAKRAYEFSQVFLTRKYCYKQWDSIISPLY